MGLQLYSNPLMALRAVATEEGVGALYRGLGLTCVKQAPTQAITFFMYETLKEVCPRW